MQNKLSIFSAIWFLCALTTATVLNSAETQGPQKRFNEIRRMLELKQDNQALAAGRRLIMQNTDFYPIYPMVADLAEACNQIEETATFFKANSKNMPARPEFIYGLGVCYERRGLKAQALSCFERAIALGIKCPHAYSGFLNCQEGKGKLGLVQNNWRERPNDPFSRYGLGLIALETRDFDTAINLFTGCLKTARESMDIDLEADCLHKMGRACQRQNKRKQAFVYIQESARLAQAAGNLSLQTTCQLDMAMAHIEAGDVSKASILEKDASRISTLMHDEMGRAQSLNVRGRIHVSQWSLRNAHDSFVAALAIFQKYQSWDNIAKIQMNLGVVYNMMGDFEQSLIWKQKALILARKINSRDREIGVLINIGNDYLDLNDFANAEAFYQQAREMAVAMQDKNMLALSLVNIGTCYNGRKQYNEALNLTTEAYQIYREIENEEFQNWSLLYIALNHFDLGQLAKARENADLVLAWAKKNSYKRMISECHLYLADIAIAAKEYVRANSEIQRALAATKIGNNSTLEWRVMLTRGKIFQEQGQWRAALKQYQTALDLLEDIRGRLFIEENKTNFFKNAQDIYQAIIELLFLLHQQNGSVGYDRQAFAYCEKAKARTFLDMLQLKKNNIRSQVDPKLLTWKKALEEEITETQKQLSNEQAKWIPNPIAIRNWKAHAGMLQKKYHDLLLKITLQHPRYAELIGIGTVLGVKGIQKLLRTDETIMEYFAGKDCWFAFAIDRDSFVSKKIPVSPTELRAKIITLRQPISDFRENKVDRSRLEWNVKAATELYQMIFAPLERAWLESRKIKPGAEHHLIIVPADILFYLPFEALAPGGPSAGDEFDYLGLHYAVSYSVSASVLDPMLKKGGPAPSGNMLAFANPDFNSRSVEASASPSFVQKKYFARAAATALPDTEIEVTAIAKIIGPSGTRIYTGKEARKSILQKECGRYTMLHIATHGILNEKDPMYSGLLLANEGSGTDDAILQNFEIYNLDLHARLVVLSACESGLGEISSGEGIIGMSRAFLYAGAEAVVVSLWQVESSTVPLMRFFYQELQNGVDPATALRRAKKQMILTRLEGEPEQGGIPDNPFFWAPFVIYGRSY